MVYITDKILFLGEYRAILTDLDKLEHSKEFETYSKIEIVDQSYHVKAIIKDYKMDFTIRLKNNEVSVVQTEQLKDQLKELEFINLTVRLNKKYKTDRELSF